MEKPIYPSSNMRITQGYNEGSHIDSFAIDDAGKDTGISKLKAPFTGIIKKIYQQDANEVWLESIDPVEYPDGTIDYMTIMFAHANDISDLFIGKRINKGEEFYSEGTKGNATGNHCHIECGRGKFTSPGWYKNSNGFYSINNGKKPEECLWLDSSINVIANYGYVFKYYEQSPNPSPITDTNNQEEILEPEIPELIPEELEDTIPSTTEKPELETPNLIFTSPKTDLYGIYLKEGQKIYTD